jgi:hypothetical protein
MKTHVFESYRDKYEYVRMKRETLPSQSIAWQTAHAS